PRVRQPVRRLQSFRRVHLEPGETATVELPVGHLWHWDVTTGRRVVETGRYELAVGSSSREIRARLDIHVEGEVIAPRAGVLRAADFDDCDGVRLVDDEVEFTREGGWIAFHDVVDGERSAPPGTRVSRRDGASLVLTAAAAGVRVR
ncbi:fibronectin type III-like domain-contianing protein, partial [Saccharothrix sp. MB29]|nr:fibronectin type III-like domain-contianing protein [Saccharothrix sp. MB29]